MSKKTTPPRWIDVYPQGTKEGDEEQKFFIALERHPKYKWRSVAALAKEANLAKEKIDKILAKYFKKGMVFQETKDESHWAYWERVPELVPDNSSTIAEKDQDDRIDKQATKTP